MKPRLASATRIVQATTVMLLGVGLFSGCAAQPTITPNQPAAVQPKAKAPYVRSARCLALDARKSANEAAALQLDAKATQLMTDSFAMTDQYKASTARFQAENMQSEARDLRTDHEMQLTATCVLEYPG